MRPKTIKILLKSVLSFDCLQFVLFGRQKTSFSGYDSFLHFEGIYQPIFPVSTPLAKSPLGVSTRYKQTTVPFLEMSAGLSYQIQRIKVSAGYRWERYFDVVDAGYAEHKDYDRTMDGPYFKVAVGFGE